MSALTDPLGPEHAEFLSSLVSVTKAMTVRFLLTLTMARDVAISMGLLGSVSTLIAMSGPSTGATDPIQSISLALVSTRWGLVIAIVAAVIQPWVITSALRRLDQVAAVQKAVNHIRRTQIGKERDEEGDPPRSSYRSHPIPLVIIDGDK